MRLLSIALLVLAPSAAGQVVPEGFALAGQDEEDEAVRPAYSLEEDDHG